MVKTKARSAAAPQRYAGIGNQAVRKATGKTWQEWFALLDEAGAVTRQHAEIVRLLPEQIDGWWSQMVAVAYEQARNLRAVHQRAGGDFAAAASKTFNVPLEVLCAAWEDARTRAAWLKAGIAVRKATPGKSMRMTWKRDDSSVNVNFYAKGEGKSQVSVQHEKLESEAEVQAAKAAWKEAFERLQAKLATMG